MNERHTTPGRRPSVPPSRYPVRQITDGKGDPVAGHYDDWIAYKADLSAQVFPPNNVRVAKARFGR